MECLHCGDCCERMSPISSPCPRIKKNGSFIFCGAYENRPDDCIRHSHPFKWCPIGFEKLRMQNPQDVAARIDAGYDLINAAKVDCNLPNINSFRIKR